MPASNKHSTRHHYVVFFLWLGLTLAAAIYFINSRLVLFDPSMKLSAIESSVIVEQAREISELKNLNLSKTIVHFTSNDCSCTQYSEEHKASINKKVRSDGFAVININLPSNMVTIVPSTPSILILDEEEKLLYFGPYSAGLACSESNGYIETVLQNYDKGYNSDLIISDVKGCYCNISS